jgi:hypothetical protein
MPFFAYAQGDWVEQNSNTTEDLSQIQFVNEQIGHAVGTNGTLLRTLDGGLNWASSLVGAYPLHDVYFIDASNGFIQSAEMIYQTENGLDFVALQLLIDEAPENDSIDYVVRKTEMNFKGSIGVISAWYSDVPQTSLMAYKYWKTLDFGVTWVEFTKPDPQATIEFLDTEHWFAAGWNLYETFDGGQSWVQQEIGFGFPPITDDCFIMSTDGGSGVVSMAYHYSFGLIDAFNGTMVIDPDVTYVTDMELEGETLYSLVYSNDGSYITQSLDFGQTYLAETDTLPEAWDLEFISEGIGWACGQNGNIWKLGQVSSVTEHETSSMVSIFPNPASDVLQIHIETPWFPTKMEIYDSSGRLVTSENFKFQVDIRELSRGSYTLRIFDSVRAEQISFIVDGQ